MKGKGIGFSNLCRKKVYDILIKFEDIHAIKYSFDLDMEKIEHVRKEI